MDKFGILKLGWVLILIVLLPACNHVYREYDRKSFPTLVWKDGQEIVFTPVIDDTSRSYRVIVGLRHHHDIALNAIGVRIEIISPSGKMRSQDHVLTIKNEVNANAGDCAGDICDLESTVLAKHRFDEVGTHQVIITHNERPHSMSGIMEIGLIIDFEK